MSKEWGSVELFRQQYDDLPKENDDREIDHRLAFKKAAENVYNGKLDKFNCASLLSLAGDICENIGFKIKYDDSFSKNKCFLCNCDKPEYKASMSTIVESFNVYYCCQCLTKIFQTERRKHIKEGER